MASRRFLSLNEAVDAVLASDSDSDCDEIDICILPPNDGADTDIEDIEDENLAADEPGDVCGQLEVFKNHSGDSNTGDEVTVAVPKEPGKKRVRSSKSSGDSAKKSKSKLPMKDWKTSSELNSQVIPDIPPLLCNTHPELVTLNAMEIFEKVFTESMVQHLKDQFELYAHREMNCPTFFVSLTEIRQFIGILLVSGYFGLTSEEDYWSTADDLGCPIVAKAMTRSRFKEIKKFCHVADNENLGESRVAKVQPIYDQLNKSFTQFGIFHQKLSIDESMVPYYGHHRAKMFIRGKPIRFGYKIWMLCSADGYPYQASIYCEKDESRPANTTLGEHVVLSLIKVVEEPASHEVYFGNFFTSHKLLTTLKSQGMRATGTVREGREGGANLTSKASFNKKPRGWYEYTCDGNIGVVRWSDNSVVTCASNYDRVNPVSKVQRHIKGKSGKDTVSQPRMIANYVSGMGGVDLMDRLLGAYRPKIKGKKWWWNLFVNAINIAAVGAWKVHCAIAQPSDVLTHKQFRREVVHGLLRSGACRKRLGGPTAPVPHCVRYDGQHHYIESTTQGRCVWCTSNTKKRCAKCGKRLHENCFSAYHSTAK